MMKPLIKYLQYCIVILTGIGIAGCADQAQVKPWDNTSLGQISFSFNDTDQDKGEIAGDILLDLPASLKPTGVSNYILYWGTSSDATGKGEKFAEVPVNFSGKVLYTVPENTPYMEDSGSYFLLFMKGTKGNEVFSGKAAAISDNFEEPKEEEKQEAEVETPEEEVTTAATASTAGEVDTPSVETPDTGDMGPEVSASVSDTPESGDVGTVEEETAPAEEEPAAVVVEEPVEVEAITIMIENVLFEFDRSYLRPEFKEQLRNDFESLENKSEVQLLIAGHADERGSNEYNLALGERRAYAVKRYLISMGFLADNIRIISYGEEKPVDPAHNEEAWRKNRRSETEIIEE